MKAKMIISKLFLPVFLLTFQPDLLISQDKQTTGEPDNDEAYLSDKEKHKAIYGNLSGKDLETSLNILNLFEKQPEWKVSLTKRAYEVFSDKQDVRFTGLLADSIIRGICDSKHIKLLGGPMLGQVSETGASVWVRTYGRASITVKVKGRGVSKFFGPVVSKPEDDYATEVKINGLKPNRSYSYSVYSDGEPVPGATGQLKTVDPRKTRIVFGTCSHRWGLTNPTIWNTMLSRDADALLVYGDVAAQDRNFEFGLHRFDYLERDLISPWEKTVANLPVYASWDDHDYLDNDKWGLGKRRMEDEAKGTDAERLEVRRIFQTSWNNPSYGFENANGGIFFRTRIGAADVIMTDNRYFRGTDGPFLGKGQMKWLEDQLLECKGPFIIITCGTMWSDYKAEGKDSWGKFDPEGREHLFNFIEEHNIPGVLLLSGDRHGARGFKIPRPSGYTFYEFEPASLGGRGISVKGLPEWKDNYLFGVAFKYAFGEFTFNARKKNPTVTFRLMMEDGSEYYKIKLTRSQLTPNLWQKSKNIQDNISKTGGKVK